MEYKKIRNSEELLSHGSVKAREAVLSVTDMVLDSLDACKRLHSLMRLDGSELVIGKKRFNLDNYERIYAFSSGKAGNHMAKAFEEILGDRLTKGVTIIKLLEEGESYNNTEVFIGGHPLPNEEGVRGAKRMFELAEQMNEKDLLIMGLTGGCSALMGYPSEGLTLSDLQEATDVMLKAGMWVMDINDIRGHLSRTQRGRLGQKIKGAKIICFEIWDAVGVDDIEDYSEPVPIMGTPVGYDTASFEDIHRLMEKWNITDKLPQRVREYLLKADPEEETPKELTNDVDYYIVNTLPDSCKLAEEHAKTLGIDGYTLTTYTEGESKDYGTFMASLARQIQRDGRPFKAPCFIFSAGETTTSIPDNSVIKGHGGPGQEMAAGFAIAASGLKNVCLLSIDSEGTDGTTSVAGALADGHTFKSVLEGGTDIRRALESHSVYEALNPAGECIFTGNTGTNLCDFNVLYVGEAE